MRTNTSFVPYSMHHNNTFTVQADDLVQVCNPGNLDDVTSGYSFKLASGPDMKCNMLVGFGSGFRQQFVP